MVHQHDHPSNHNQSGINLSFSRIVLYSTVGIIAFFLITEHWAHLIPFLPYSLLFVCLIMHAFMHGGHGGHGGSSGNNQSP